MSMLRETFARIAGFFGRRRALEENLEAELRAHLALAAEEKVRGGMSPEEARRAARREFGGVEQTKEVYREQRGLPFVDTLVSDLRYGLRMLRKARGFTFVAILALG